MLTCCKEWQSKLTPEMCRCRISTASPPIRSVITEPPLLALIMDQADGVNLSISKTKSDTMLNYF
jgi:hypothetical protein